MSRRILILAAAGFVLTGLAAEIRAHEADAEISMKNIDGININNLPAASKVLIVGDYPDIAEAFEASGVEVAMIGEDNVHNYLKPDDGTLAAKLQTAAENRQKAIVDTAVGQHGKDDTRERTPSTVASGDALLATSGTTVETGAAAPAPEKKPSFKGMTKAELQAYLTLEPKVVAFETDANKEALVGLAEEKYASLQGQGA